MHVALCAPPLLARLSSGQRDRPHILYRAKTFGGFDSGMRGDDKEAWVISAGPTTAERVRRLRFDRFAYQYYDRSSSSNRRACPLAIACLRVWGACICDGGSPRSCAIDFLHDFYESCGESI